MYILGFIITLMTSFVQAMVPGHNFSNKDLIEYAQKFKQSNASCMIISQDSGGQLSGVLIAPNVVATAAHGMVGALHNSPYNIALKGLIKVTLSDTYIQFHEHEPMRKAKYALIDQRYLDGGLSRTTRYDIAFIILQNPVFDKPPAPLAKKLALPKQAIFTVISHGNSDIRSIWDRLIFWRTQHTFIKRAFSLLEWAPYIRSSSMSMDDIQMIRTLSYASLFFDARKTFKSFTIHDDPIYQRTMQAIENWNQNGRPPFALALPGTSGSPVFAHIEGGLALFGIISAFAPMREFLAPRGTSELEKILHNPKGAIGKYQTIFASLYKENTHIILEGDYIYFELDPIVVDILNAYMG